MPNRNPRFVLVVGIFLFSSLAHAETRLGLEMGANFSSYSFTPEPASIKGRTGVLAGGVLEFGLSDVFVAQPGLRYIQKGFSSGSYHQTEHYVEVPLMVKARIRLSDRVRAYAIAGPNFGWEFAQRFSSYLGAVLFNDLDVTFEFGGGAEFAVTPKVNLFFQGRYALGLINVVEADNTRELSAKSHGVQLSAGVTIPL